MEQAPKPTHPTVPQTTVPNTVTQRLPAPIPTAGASIAMMVTVSDGRQTQTVVYGQRDKPATN